MKKVSTPPSGQKRQVRAQGLELRHLTHGQAVDALHHQQVRTGQVGVDAGNVEQRRAGEVLPQPLGVGRLPKHVQFRQHGLGVVRRHLRQAQALAGGDVLVDPAGQPSQHLQIGPHGFLYVWAHHLHHHFGTVAQGRAMHLSDGGGGDGHEVEALYPGRKGVPQGFFHDGPRLFPGKRRHMIL